MIIEILNWDKYCPRKDLKATTWLRLQNTIFEDPNFYEFDHAEICFWIYLLSQASKKQTGTIRLSTVHAERVGRFREKTQESALKKLQELQCVRITHDDPNIDVTCTSRGCDTDVTPTSHYVTNERTNETKRNVTNETEMSHSQASALPRLAEIWNSHCGRLPKVEKCGNQRLRFVAARWKENPSEEYWIKVIRKLADSPFCNGKSNTGWRASFDFLIQPETQHKAIEGKYDDPNSTRIASHRKEPDAEEQELLAHLEAIKARA